MSKDEILLTWEEINSILEDARTNILGKYSGLRTFANSNPSPLTILRITDTNGLILIRGQKYTGYEHIKLRHNSYNPNVYWRDENTKFVIEKPSLFPKEIPPLYFADVADQVFKPDNKLENNRTNSPFDVYEGFCTISNVTEKYKLLLYTETKIIHTLYPINNKLKTKKVKNFDFARGEVIVDDTTDKTKRFIAIPYHTYEGIFMYDIIIEKDFTLNKENIYIRRLNNNQKNALGSILLLTRELIEFKFPSKEGKYYQQADLTSIEREILNFHKYLEGQKR
ncbi:MAG: hypothetical protein BGO88_08895 [Flavobacterium sp. 38-13]|uniref:hypothetical protein n=1 Tax=Flavobacterium sp. 38-13 TaxID=1896168 RepID=UPI00096153E9|nr:hypothetical protein [Flavobacterium sp. 38-13]OJX49857.1 MAG: hypothetical protein BGO88_08895 [Flavobacterium sp. 38-13]